MHVALGVSISEVTSHYKVSTVRLPELRTASASPLDKNKHVTRTVSEFGKHLSDLLITGSL